MSEDGPGRAAGLDEEGFLVWEQPGDGRFADMFGPFRLRVEDGKVRCRIDVERRHTNPRGAIHGGLILALIDTILFVGPAMLRRMPSGGGVTLGLSTDFIAATMPGKPLDAVVEIVGETGRMLFLSGRVEQEGVVTASFTGTMRKTPRRDTLAGGG